MKLKRRKSRKIVSELNITNLVDITFALLIIFMITAPMMTQGVQVDLPQADAENVESKESIKVSINNRNEIFINDKRVPIVKFKRYFKQVFKGQIETPVFINADKKVPYGLVIKIITDIQEAGAVKLGFLTQPSEEEK